jgi:sugar phosphate isomerase/epimerase
MTSVQRHPSAPQGTMRLALSGTEVSEHEGVDPLVSSCRETGVRWVELWYPRNTMAHGVDEALRRLSAENIGVACIGTATELGGDGDPAAAQAVVIQAVELAARISCGMVNTYFGWPAVRDDAKAIETYVRHVQPCLRTAERNGVILTIENEFDSFGVDSAGADVTRRPAALRALVEAVGVPHFRIAFDACNALFAGVDPERMYREIAAYVAYIHVKDGMAWHGRSDAAPWRSYTDSGVTYATCPLGQGQIDWDRLLTAAADDGYRGYLAVEPHSVPSARSAAWAQAATYLRSLLGAVG